MSDEVAEKKKRGRPPGPRPVLRDAQVAAAMAYLSGNQTSEDMAAAAGKAKRTVDYWRKDPKFIALLAELDRERTDACRAVIRDSVAKAARRMQALLADDTADLKFFDLVTLVDKLSRLMPEPPSEEQEEQAAVRMLQQLEAHTRGVPAVAGVDLFTQVYERLVAAGKEETNGHGLR